MVVGKSVLYQTPDVDRNCGQHLKILFPQDVRGSDRPISKEKYIYCTVLKKGRVADPEPDQ
jgi:hypothetical protein